jgi:hypothetical protein
MTEATNLSWSSKLASNIVHIVLMRLIRMHIRIKALVDVSN